LAKIKIYLRRANSGGLQKVLNTDLEKGIVISIAILFLSSIAIAIAIFLTVLLTTLYYKITTVQRRWRTSSRQKSVSMSRT